MEMVQDAAREQKPISHSNRRIILVLLTSATQHPRHGPPFTFSRFHSTQLRLSGFPFHFSATNLCNTTSKARATIYLFTFSLYTTASLGLSVSAFPTPKKIPEKLILYINIAYNTY
jgi:hypothetical protein